MCFIPPCFDEIVGTPVVEETAMPFGSRVPEQLCRQFDAQATAHSYPRFGLIRGLVLLLAALSLLSCARSEISDRGLGFNDALNDYGNRQVLLNIIRTSYSYPMEFSAASSVNSSSVLNQGSLSVTAPFGPGTSGQTTVTPGVQLAEGIAGTWSPLETAEFYQAFLNPTTAQTLAFYLQRGWPSGLIFSTFIQNVTMTPYTFAVLRRMAFEKIRKGCISDRYARSGKYGYDEQRGSGWCFYIPNEIDFARLKGCDFDTLTALPLNELPIRYEDYSSMPLISFQNSPVNPCGFFKFQYLTQILDALYYRLLAGDPPGKGSGKGKNSGSGSNSSSQNASGSPGSSSTPNTTTGPTGATNSGSNGSGPNYYFEVNLRDASGGTVPYACRRPHEMFADLARISRFARVLSKPSDIAYQMSSPVNIETLTSAPTMPSPPPNPPPTSAPSGPSASWSLGPIDSWFTDLTGALAGRQSPDKPVSLNSPNLAHPDRIVFNMNEFADQSPGSSLGPITSLADLQAAALAILAEFEDNDCDTGVMPVMELRSPEAMFHYFGTVLQARQEANDLDPPTPQANYFGAQESYCSSNTIGFHPMYIQRWVRKGSTGAPVPPSDWEAQFDQVPQLATLFDACDGDSQGAAISVQSKELGRSYYVAAPVPPMYYNQTLHAVDLLRQILALQTLGSQLVNVPTVRVLGQ
jgi:hypothetical protein